ncbi:carboxypeptidase regulatory-like domain-containing protein [Marinirhabdus gelatinilytica]|uniref:Carboxypeptidase-like protein n=1 Tax=Marinirhabdus gelatinilytica TaxID=1703343 RepID=A0A370Q6Z0_9FLAO|nr:carboxypeptidase regulatory-like domain-containing protein [Marinirhabdus gelatinilytica]RDK83820.1 carboxypeptidase-like protein [Marinirhabdus gelatinilytica]
MKNILWALVLLSSISVSAQSIKVRGVIKDSLNTPLEFANVVATVSNSGAIESYAISNEKGMYQLDLPKGETYDLKASFLGYQTQQKTVAVAEDDDDKTLDFILNSLADELDGVEITYEMPVTVKGDTIVYNADSFTTGDERKLGDVMKKLPGVEVNDDGEIQVEGKTVQKVMVEGKDFFDGDSKLATKNIPADAVDKVEVLRNYNEVNQMRGLGNDQDNVAINIKLKEGKKNFWFGEVAAGGGTINEDEFGYLAHPKLFYYSPEYSLNFITDFNNIGEVPFTFRDYFNFTGGFRNFNQGGGTRFNVSESDLSFAVAQNNRANEIETKFLAGNFSWKASNSLDVSGFGIFSDNRTNIVTNSIRQYISTGATENTSSNTDQRSQLAMLKLSGVYKPNSDLQVDYDALIKTNKQTEDANTLSQFGPVNNNIEENKENTPVAINQNVNAYYTLNDKNIFAAQIQHLYQDEDPFYSAITDILPFAGIIPADTTQNRFNTNQQKNIITNKLDAKVDYYYVLNNTSNLNFTLGSTYSNQLFDSSIFQVLDNGNRLNFTNTPEINGETLPLTNDVNYTFTDVFLGLHYKLKTGQFIFTPGATLHNYNLKDEQLGTENSQNDWMVLPDFNAIWNIKKSESLRFNYALSAQYTDVNDYAEAFVFNNYNRLFRGNRNLENSLAHTYTLTYFSFNLFNYTNVSGNISYSKTLNNFKNNTEIIAINQVSNPFNIDSNFPDEVVSAFGRFSKRIKKLQFTLQANGAYSIFNNFINNQIVESESFTQNYRASVRSSFREWPNFEVGYRLVVNQYDNGGREQTFYTQRPFANVDVNFLKHFTLSAEWDYYNYTDANNTVENDYSFVNANLYYQKGDSPWEFKLQADNLLNTEFTNQDSFNEQFNTTSQYFVLPRILMLVVKYEL